MFGATSTPSYNPNKDSEIASSPSDGISSLSWCPRPGSSFLIGTSWDNGVYCWEVNSSRQSQPKAHTRLSAPPLCSCWSPDGTVVFAGGFDNMVKRWDLATNSTQQVAAHEAGVRACHWIPEMNLLLTGSYDKTLRYWDTRQAQPAFTFQLPERCYALDVKHPLAVCGTADRKLLLFNLAAPTQCKVVESPLKWQTRTLACFPDSTGFLIGSIEGRVAAQHVEDSAQTKNFTFRCHRDASDIYPVNSIVFHPVHHTFVTAGSDGTYNFWDKDSKLRLKAMAKCLYSPTQPAPISCSAYNQDGSIYAYALSYDWCKGVGEYNPATMKNVILLHQCNDQEVKARPMPVAATRK